MVRHINKFELSEFSPGNVYRVYFDLISDSFGRPISLPLIIAMGKKPGKTLGLTAAVHGNELNGIKVIHNLIDEVGGRLGELSGNIIAVPGVNVPGIHRHARRFVDGIDLNRVMPGKAKGNASEVFASRFLKRIVSKFDFLVDLHTASFGRVNSYYVRADLEDSLTYRMALSQHPQIVLHNKGRDGSLRSAAAKMGIPAITVEVGNPQLFQNDIIQFSYTGLKNLLDTLGLLSNSWEPELDPSVCSKSQWIYTDEGGLLEVLPKVAAKVQKGEVISRITNIFGELRKTYTAPFDSIVIGKSTNPAGQTGARIIHLGVEDPGFGQRS